MWGDYIDAGSWAVIAAVTGGDVEISGARAADMEVVAAVLKRLNVECGMAGDLFRVEQSKPKAAGRLTTGLWPGFPSDLVSLVTVLATQADGRTLVHDWLYELRLFALEQLSGMSADLFLCDPHRIIVTGPRRLRGRPLDSRDLRSGMALIAAALAADGQSRLSPLETVERGYGHLGGAAPHAWREGRASPVAPHGPAEAGHYVRTGFACVYERALRMRNFACT